MPYLMEWPRRTYASPYFSKKNNKRDFQFSQPKTWITSRYKACTASRPCELYIQVDDIFAQARRRNSMDRSIFPHINAPKPSTALYRHKNSSLSALFRRLSAWVWNVGRWRQPCMLFANLNQAPISRTMVRATVNISCGFRSGSRCKLIFF